MHSIFPLSNPSPSSPEDALLSDVLGRGRPSSAALPSSLVRHPRPQLSLSFATSLPPGNNSVRTCGQSINGCIRARGKPTGNPQGTHRGIHRGKGKERRRFMCYYEGACMSGRRDAFTTLSLGAAIRDITVLCCSFGIVAVLVTIVLLHRRSRNRRFHYHISCGGAGGHSCRLSPRLAVEGLDYWRQH